MDMIFLKESNFEVSVVENMDVYFSILSENWLFVNASKFY
jgi:hypothetical protein